MTNYLIVSNNANLALQLKQYLQQLPHIQATITTVALLHKHQPHVILADPECLQHPAMAQLMAHKPNTIKVCMCNITAIEQHQDMANQVFGYLPLPLSFERIVALTQNIHAMKEGYQPDKKKDYVFVKSDYKLIKTNFNDIIFLEGMKDYTQIHLKGVTKTLTTLQNLKEFEQKLPADEFVRVHRSYIVSVNHIESISRSEVVVARKSIPIGDAYRQSLDMIVARYS
jgi:DNA-binding LytR/AlgR family response regulator